MPISDSEPMQQTSIWIPKTLHRRSRVIAAKNNCTFRELVALGLEMACDRMDTPHHPEAQ